MALAHPPEPTPPDVGPAGHVAGLVGDFRVEETSEADPFLDSITRLAQKLENPDATLLKRPILSPQEWLDDSYFSGTLKRDFWPQKLVDFPEHPSSCRT